MDKRNEKYAGAYNPPKPSELPIPRVASITLLTRAKPYKKRVEKPMDGVHSGRK